MVTMEELEHHIADQSIVIYINSTCRAEPCLVAEFTNAFADHPKAALAYSDEFRHDAHNRLKDMFCKPAWDPLYFSHTGYTGSLFAIKGVYFKKAIRQNPALLPFGAALMDYCLPFSEGSVIHLPKPLFSCRQDEQIGKLNIIAPLNLSKHPSVSILLPFKDRLDLLRTCLESLFSLTDYPNWECILIDNNSCQAATMRYLAALKHERIKIMRTEKPFNFSSIVNDGAAVAGGDILLLLNSDTRVINTTWLASMVAWSAMPQIGCVGAKLFYPNQLVQHGGVIMGMGGIANPIPMMGHAHAGWPADSPGYYGMLEHSRTVSAVTGAVMAVRRSLFEQVGGFDPSLAQAFNDVDFCLKVAKLGLRNIWTPQATLYHHESATRGWKHTRQSQEDMQRDYMFMCRRWGKLLEEDLWYNPNLANGFSHVLAHEPRPRNTRELPLEPGTNWLGEAV